MPNPKRRHSQQRSAKRRTHYKAQIETLSTDKITGETHMRHRAHWVENKMYYRGRVVLEKAIKEVADDTNEA
ncbi:MAG: 50S ribosomal protein L32 [Chitinophagaceae bacterium]|nr:50S ribosomal protein L32 [Chitinophagaceae bacterium]